MIGLNFELNITLQCNLKCHNCNRMCNLFPDRTEHMSLEQIERFIEQVKKAGGIKKIKVLGGEPLLNPEFEKIYARLVETMEEGYIRSVKLDTNSVIPLPKLKIVNGVRFLSTRQHRKIHYPYVWNPQDLNLQTKGPCPNVGVCGVSLDKYGYVPCSPAIMLVRLYGLTHLYKREIPNKFWGFDEICKYCICSAPREFLNQHCKKLKDMTQEEKTPTKSLQEALDKWNPEEFYRTQPEF